MKQTAGQEPSVRADIATLELAESNMRPSGLELQTMARDLMRRKNWSMKHLSMATGIKFDRISKLVNNPDCANSKVVEQRSLWMLWMLDVAPSALFDFMQIVHWGRWSSPSFTTGDFMEIPLPDRKAMIVALEELGRMKVRLTLREVASKFSVTEPAAAELCRQSAYEPDAEKTIPEKVPEFLRPGSIWREIDWNVVDERISHNTGLSMEVVCIHRAKINQLNKEDLLEEVLRLVGADPENFKIFF